MTVVVERLCAPFRHTRPLSQPLTSVLAASEFGPNSIVPIFVTVDPARDTPEAIKKYLRDFHPSMVGLTGPYQAIKDMCRTYRVYFSTPPDKKPGEDYLVDHSMSVSFLRCILPFEMLTALGTGQILLPHVAKRLLRRRLWTDLHQRRGAREGPEPAGRVARGQAAGGGRHWALIGHGIRIALITHCILYRLRPHLASSLTKIARRRSPRRP